LQKQIDDNNLNIPLAKYQAAIWVVAGVGGFLFLTGFLGCCGAACENRVLLGLFFTIVLVLFLLELGAGIAALVMKDQFKDDITKAIQELKGKGADALLPIQDNFNCCGTDGTDGYGAGCPTGQTAKPGCIDAVWAKIKSNMTAAGAIAIVVLVIELLAMIFACVLCSAMRSGGYNYA